MFFYSEIDGIVPLVLSVNNSNVSFANTCIGDTSQNTFVVSATAGNVTETITLSDNTDQYSFSPSTFSLSQNTSQTITVTFIPTSWGIKTGSIAVAASNGSTANVNLSAICIANPLIITSSVGNLNFGSGYVNETSSATFVISAGGRVQDIVLLADDSDQFDFSPSSVSMTGTNQTQSITVYFTPTSNGSKLGVLTLSASGGDVAHVSLTGSGVYRPLVLTSNTNSLVFGGINAVGSTYTSSFNIISTGTGAAETITLSDNTDQYSLSPASFSLTGSSSRTITASFSPTSVGTKTGSIAFSSSGGSTGSISLYGVASEQYYGSTALLLKGEDYSFDINGNTNNFVDSSTNAVNITPYGNVSRTSTQFKYGAYSIYFDGNGDYLSAPASSNYNFGSGNFTVEMWINPTSGLANNTQKHLFGNRASTALFRSILSFMTYNSAQARYSLSFYATLNSTTWGVAYTTPTAVISPNVWTHVAFVRNGNEYSVFINGVKTVMSTIAGTITSDNSPFVIGSNSITNPGANGYLGYMDEFRITKGIARYTSTFTPGPL